jgi:BirA family biotin operon repressor/biotin-[acetyl-CoA-carboxylase] ligase
MEHIHLKQCQSTQEESFNYLESKKDELVLVSSENQRLGRGQRGKSWFSSDHSLAMSFNLVAAHTLSLTSLEIGVLTSNFFKEKYDISIYLKWPNDLFFKGKKCGGILIQKNKFLICGIGINLYHDSEFPKNIPSIIDLNIKDIQIKDLALDLYNFINKNRLSDEVIREQFHEKCIHLNKMVEIREDNQSHIGKFLEIGPYGEARVEIQAEVRNFYSASLAIL